MVPVSEIIQNNLHRAPMFGCGGEWDLVTVRRIEDKIVRFMDKESLNSPEPEGRNTEEVYAGFQPIFLRMCNVTWYIPSKVRKCRDDANGLCYRV